MIPGQGRAERLRRPDRAATVAWVAGPVALLALPVSYAAAFSSAGGIDLEDDCAAVGQPFVHSEVFFPHGERRAGGARWFPLSRACNADHDMVPVWVDPTIAGASAVALVVLTVLRRRARRVCPSDPEVS